MLKLLLLVLAVLVSLAAPLWNRWQARRALRAVEAVKPWIGTSVPRAANAEAARVAEQRPPSPKLQGLAPAKRTTRTPMAGLLDDRRALARAMVASEILGPPVSLRDR